MYILVNVVIIFKEESYGKQKYWTSKNSSINKKYGER
jgi:hypothetical protein